MDYSPFYCKNFYNNRKKQGKPPASGYNGKSNAAKGNPVASNPMQSGYKQNNPAASNPMQGGYKQNNPAASNPMQGGYAGNSFTNASDSGSYTVNASADNFSNPNNGNQAHSSPAGSYFSAKPHKGDPNQGAASGSNLYGNPIGAEPMQGCYGDAGQSCGIPMQDNGNPVLKPFALRSGKRKRRKGFFVTVLIILCFAIVAVGANLFGGGFVLDGLKSTFGTNYLDKHYFVAKGGFVTKQKAEQDALSVREGGAAGYVYSTNKGYYVVLASYKDKKSAESVKGKNDGVEVIEVTIRELPKANLSPSQAKVCEKVQKLIIADIDALYTIIEQLAKNIISSDAAAARLLDMRNELLNAKGELLDVSLPVDVRNAYLNAAEPMFGGLDAVVFKEPDEYFIASLRYILAQSIAAFAQA